MTFANCLTRLVSEGTIDAERAARFAKEYDRLNSGYAKTMGRLDAELQASRDAMDALDWQAQQSSIQKMKQLGVQRGLLDEFTQHLEAGGSAGKFLAGIMDSHDATAFAGVANDSVAIGNMAWARMGRFTDRYKRNMVGVVSNRAELDDVARALRGEKVDNANARLVGDSIADTFEWLRLQFNRAGGAIPRLKNWGMPQSHDAQLIARAGAKDWKDFIRPLLDPAAMIDRQTGKGFSDPAVLDEALDDAFRNITSEGMDGQVPGAFTNGGKLANRRADHRFLIFKDSDAWLAYNERFGQGDLFDAITGHIASMSSDIAAMRRLGPNPALTVRWLKDLAAQDALPTLAGGPAIALTKDARKGAGLLERQWLYYSGALTMPASRGTARFFQGARNWNVATKLGSAFTTAFWTDPNWGLVNARFNGLSEMNALKNYVGSFNPLDASHRQAARHAGLVAHELTTRSERMWRQGAAMRFNLTEFTRRSADFVLRATLLTPSTLAWKESAGLSWMMDWGDIAGTGWGALGKGRQLAFERYGIDAADWDLLRSTPVIEDEGITLLRPGDLARRDDIDPDTALASAVKFFAMIDAETKRRVVGEGLRAQTEAITLFGGAHLNKGTIPGELLHSMTQFKTFGIAAVINTWQRAVHGRGAMSPAAFVARTLIGAWVGGMIAEQMWQIWNGKDPLPWDEMLLMRGFIRGGGGGILADILGQGFSNDRGDTLVGYASGPLLRNIVDPAVNLTLGNSGGLMRGEETNAAREGVRFLKENIPGGNAWYGRLALNRLILDALDEMADPDYRQAWRRMERRAHDQGTEYFWEPGDASPDRAPDFGPAFAMDEGSLQ